MREQEVGNIASADSQQIAEYIRKVDSLDQKRSKAQVPDHGNGSGATIKRRKRRNDSFLLSDILVRHVQRWCQKKLWMRAHWTAIRVATK